MTTHRVHTISISHPFQICYASIVPDNDFVVFVEIGKIVWTMRVYDVYPYVIPDLSKPPFCTQLQTCAEIDEDEGMQLFINEVLTDAGVAFFRRRQTSL